MSAWITHLGHALPGPPLAQSEIISWLSQRLAPGTDPARLKRFSQLSGVDFRHAAIDLFGADGDALYPADGTPADTLVRSQTFARLAAPLAAAAVRAACPDGVGTITHLIVATCTGAVAPGLDLQLIGLLELPRSVRRTMVGFMGCYAALPALRIAADTVRADPLARVLVVCCELSSLHLQTGPDDGALIAACLFGDGAAAAIVAGSPEKNAHATNFRIVKDACTVVPDTADAMAWIAAADGFHLRLAPTIATALSDALPALTDTLLGDVPRSHVHWLVHPGGPRILEKIAQTLGLPDEAVADSRTALATAGNRSSATVLAMLADSARGNWSGPAALFGFGPGLTAECLLLERS